MGHKETEVFDILEALEFDENQKSEEIEDNIEILNSIEGIEEIVELEPVLNEESNSNSDSNKDEVKIEAKEANISKVGYMAGKYKILKKIYSYFAFTIKYITTSSLIFFLLLITTNYSAYYNIAKSYIYKNELKTNEQSLITSVEASNILKKEEEKKVTKQKNIEIIEEKQGVDENMYHSINKLIAKSNKSDVNLDIEITPFEDRIIIPKIGKNIPLLDIKNKEINGLKELNNIFLKELENGVIRYPSSAKPGEQGNAFIFGHSSNFPWIKGDYNEVFSLLDNVDSGDTVIVYYNQKKYTYTIKEKKVIKPSDVSILKRKEGKSELTIMTCWPIGTTLNRLIVIGDLVEE